MTLTGKTFDQNSIEDQDSEGMDQIVFSVNTGELMKPKIGDHFNS